MAFELETTLSDKPSELILQALGDLAEVEKNDQCEVDMGNFFAINADDHKPCVLCLAGSVMYQGSPELRGIVGDRTGPYRYVIPQNFEPRIEAKLGFLSDMQFGFFGRAFGKLGIKLPDFLPIMRDDFPEYEKDPAAYKAALIDIATKLGAIGL